MSVPGSGQAAGAGGTASGAPSVVDLVTSRFQNASDLVLGGGAGLGAFLADERLDVFTSASPGAAGIIALAAGLSASTIWKKRQQRKEAEALDLRANRRVVDNARALEADLRDRGATELADQLHRAVDAYHRDFIDMSELKARIGRIFETSETLPPRTGDARTEPEKRPLTGMHFGG